MKTTVADGRSDLLECIRAKVKRSTLTRMALELFRAEDDERASLVKQIDEHEQAAARLNERAEVAGATARDLRARLTEARRAESSTLAEEVRNTPIRDLVKVERLADALRDRSEYDARIVEDTLALLPPNDTNEFPLVRDRWVLAAAAARIRGEDLPPWPPVRHTAAGEACDVCGRMMCDHAWAPEIELAERLETKREPPAITTSSACG